ncbi:MAG: DUF1890 domain-containing protein [Methanomicrobiales archaeon]|nr:DUF1890 domain-containing protein [Methanomicrobiales archaeon]
MPEDESRRVALLVMGCPKVPVQTSLVLYLAHRLKKAGIKTIIAGTPSARQLIRVADPDGHYTMEMKDLDATIAALADEKLSVTDSYVFVHNDAGISYTATMVSLTKKPVTAIIFGEEAEQMKQEITFPCTVIAQPATHNPMPLKKKIEEAAPWDV